MAGTVVRQTLGQFKGHFEAVVGAVAPASQAVTKAASTPLQALGSEKVVAGALETANKFGHDAAKYGDYFAQRFPQGMQAVSDVGISLVGNRAKQGVEVANDVFKALGIQIWIVHPGSSNARVRIHVDENHRTLEGVDSSAAAMTPREFVGFMRSARHTGGIGGSDLEAYMESLVLEAELQSVPMLPAAFERKLYMDIAQLILFTFQRSLLTLDNAEIWGHTLKVDITSVPERWSARPGQAKRSSIVGQAQLQVIVDHMLASKVVSMPLLPGPMQRRLFTNCVTVVFMLLEDLLTGEEEGVTFMGHKMRFQLSPLPVNLVKRLLAEQPVHHCHINELALTELVDELLAHADTNLAWMPDVLESRLYQSTMRLLIRIVEQIVSRMQLSVLGRHIDMSILSHLDMSRRKMEKDQMALSGATYYEEDNPLLTISTTELEERVKHLDERRRVLQAIRGLRGASFDLTQETPMLGDHVRDPEQLSDSAAGDASAAGAVEEREPHEFQRLAPTLKLARSLNQVFEVDADIEVPFSMIADLAGYANWMPWCTSGEAPPSASGPFDKEMVFDGKVGFGFETGTFLGTVGDTVNYQVTVEPPKEGRGRVLADAVNGFTYGKRLAYDWRFTSVGEGKTEVELNMLFQAHNVLYMPIWDSMQNMVVNGMLGAFQKRAAVLTRESVNRPPEKMEANEPKSAEVAESS